MNLTLAKVANLAGSVSLDTSRWKRASTRGREKGGFGEGRICLVGTTEESNERALARKVGNWVSAQGTHTCVS